MRALVFLLAGACTVLALETHSRKPSTAPKPVSPAPALVVPQDTRPFTNAPKGGGISAEGTEETLRDYTSVTVQFPTDMVSADKIDAEDVPSPIAIWPDLNASFVWRTPSQGDLTVNGPFIPGQTYRFRLRAGLTDLAGKVLPEREWGFEMTTPVLQVTGESYDRNSLNSRPQIPLEFNYPMRLSDVAQGIWFQNRLTRERLPVEVLLNRAEGELENDGSVDVSEEKAMEITEFRVRPIQPLPIGHQYDLIVDGVFDAYAGRTLAYPKVFPLGRTNPLSVEYVAAKNAPLEKPCVEVKFHQLLEEGPLPEDALTFTPAVPNLRFRKEGGIIFADGDFDVAQRYKVVVSDKITAVSGYHMPASESWGATFHPKEGTIIFPAREIRERSALGLAFNFFQVNTSELEWKLATIPLEQLPVVRQREREFDSHANDEKGNPLWTKEGFLQRETSEPLIPALGLNVMGSGRIPASSGEKEILRAIAWKPEGGVSLEGPMLLEVTGTNAKGRTIGNRAVIYFGDLAVTRKQTSEASIVRIANLSDAQPVASAEVVALDEALKPITTTKTDESGIATFKANEIFNAAYFLARAGKAFTIQPLALATQLGGSLSDRAPPSQWRSHVLTDRPLYRPGQSVQFKGIVREERAGSLAIPVGKPVKWSIEREYGNEVFASGETKVDAEGSWNGAWLPPKDSPLGGFVVKMKIDGRPAGESTRFQIEEFRNPPFSVVCESAGAKKPAQAVISVQSQYFHGAPNAGASVKWTATWLSDSEDGYYSGNSSLTRVDLFSEHARQPSFMAEISGETALDGNGAAILSCEAPFKDPGNRAYSQVSWKVEVTGPDGQTITGGTSGSIPMDTVLLGVDGEHAGKDLLEFRWDAAVSFGNAPPQAVNAQLFYISTKSVKERLAPNVYRYRNFDQYQSVEKRDNVSDEKLAFKPAKPGRYVLVVSPLKGQPGFPVSEEVFLPGEGDSEVPVQSEAEVAVMNTRLQLNGGGKPNDQPWYVGETAMLNVLSPSGGVAWVSVETDRILDTFTTPIQGNTSRIEIPIKPEYEPGAYVTVYLLRPGGSDTLAGEMFGSASLTVSAPDRVLDVTLKTDKPEYQPREKISGEITVSAAGQPVPEADLLVYAVDDSILTLGDWRLPRLLPSFFPNRPHGVLTYSALDAYVDKIAPSWLTMKGYVVGGGGADEFSNVTFVRKEFKPLILWRPNVKTDARGIAKFVCDAPDNLTRFRVIAIGQTKKNQFGGGDATFTVSKNLIIEPSLPRFLRMGDEVELRAVARQKIAGKDTLTVRCTTGGSLELIGDAVQEVAADKDAPVVVRFKARAGAVGAATAKFEIISSADSKLTDAIEITMPIVEPVILKKESVAGSLTGPAFSAREIMPADWKQGRGTFQLSLSTSPWLAKLMGLPYLLEYPHGCFEQKSSRLLAYTYLGELLKYLPEAKGRMANYGAVIEQTCEEFEASLLPDGMMPYWPNGTQGSDYTTIQIAWCISQAETAGFAMPERLATELPQTLEKMVLRKIRPDMPATLRAFALFVLSTYDVETKPELTAAAEELFLNRDKLTGEGKAMLAIALRYLEIAEDKQLQLVSELPYKFSDITFNPETFSSATRTEALCIWARLLVVPREENQLQERLAKLMESSSSLSTQENLWLLVAFDALLDETPPSSLRAATLKPKPDAVSENKSAVAWSKQDIARLADFAVAGLPSLKQPGSYVLSAAYRTGETQTPLVSQGMRIERVVKNLTDATREGTAQAPFQLGDQLLISYRFYTDKPQSYVAVEDTLPAGIEIVNPNLALFGKYYSIPAQPGLNEAALSFSEMRDKQANLYFDRLTVGAHGYSILARATAAGTFIWPATQMTPMYDSRFFGRSPSGICVVTSP